MFENVGTRIETVLHTVLKYQVDRACFHEEEPPAVRRRTAQVQ